MFFLAPRPGNRQPSGPIGAAEAKDVSPVAGGKVAAATLGEARQPTAADFQGQLGADDIAIVAADQGDAQPMIARLYVVAQESDGSIEVVDDDVGAAIVSEVAESGAAAVMILLDVGSALGADLAEAAVR